MPRGNRESVDKTTQVTRDYTINLHKRTHKISFKKRAPRAIREIRKFAAEAMGTSDVRVDTSLNMFVWSKGVRHVPNRVRVRISRRRNDDEDAKEKMYSLCSLVEVKSFKDLPTQNVSEE
mmetsp:Transcript_17061/g.19062  ORF Transcript_17061/g.19062 Transcript_17061/m.19062 type:complete len:120 (-) Transcript_17061:40-399(-)|eukprot:CAMPEP_0205820904 /NCGR_PEP_ID=MMETSP0206-20130828/3706_1 /ASSEMBLY_ACC=CAM_ASM_000279 /TAXON_ID=36767 /ORGANISM="Euplotes focardii, Strain TN1" /LENGTH=119 /DNA_ID=CAMNT_0053116013 /DNA_START=73 /DNA_END=432 /DNA_ORIENTATION=+